MNVVQQYWSDHGTKIIGFGSSVIGAISLVDATTVHMIEQLLGPHRGHQVSSAMLVIGGLGTAWRGFTNTKRGP